MSGIGGIMAVTAALAVGSVIAITRSPDESEVEEPATVLEDFTEDVRAQQTKNFPAFAPEGVIVVQALGREERGFVAEEAITQEGARTYERIEVRRTAERERRGDGLRQRVRASGPRSTPSPVSVTRIDSDAPRARELDEPPDLGSTENNAEEPRYDMGPTGNEAPEAREYEEARQGEAYGEEGDNRSWYGSPAYRREVEERRRAQREAQRRQNGS
jgi:hypothetical protein